MNGHLRNLPCPCGSGRKVKRCCGAPKPTPDARESPFAALDRMDREFVEQLARSARAKMNQLRIAATVPKPAGVPCPECRDTGEVWVAGAPVPCPHKCPPSDRDPL